MLSQGGAAVYKATIRNNVKGQAPGKKKAKRISADECKDNKGESSEGNDGEDDNEDI